MCLWEVTPAMFVRVEVTPIMFTKVTPVMFMRVKVTPPYPPWFPTHTRVEFNLDKSLSFLVSVYRVPALKPIVGRRAVPDVRQVLLVK